MKFEIEIHMDNIEGILERILGRLRQRGFSVCTMLCNRTADHNHLNARITVESKRPSDLAEKQLAKLHDVQYVRVKQLEETDDYRFEPKYAANTVEFNLPVRHYA